jgi:predicted nucleic acid-binding protein
VIVLDASAFVSVLLRLEPSASAIAARLREPGESLHAPHLFDSEIVQTLRRYFLRGQLSSVRAGEALCDLADLRLTRYPHLPLVGRVWELRDNLSAFDAVYVALSEALAAPLITCDARLARAPGHHARIDVFG